MFFEYNIDTKIVAANAGGLRKWPLSYGSFAMRSISYQSLPPSIPHKEQISDCEEAFSMQRQVCSWHDGCPLSPDYISHHFKFLLERNKLPHIRFHDLRHTAGSLLLEDGVDIKIIQEFLGHSQASTTTNIYLHSIVRGGHVTANSLNRLFS